MYARSGSAEVFWRASHCGETVRKIKEAERCYVQKSTNRIASFECRNPFVFYLFKLRNPLSKHICAQRREKGLQVPHLKKCKAVYAYSILLKRKMVFFISLSEIAQGMHYIVFLCRRYRQSLPVRTQQRLSVRPR